MAESLLCARGPSSPSLRRDALLSVSCPPSLSELWRDAFLDGTRKKDAILPNEPTDCAMKNRVYHSGRQGVAVENHERNRWVRFGERTHREAILSGLMWILTDSRQLLEGGEDGVEFACAEGAEDLGFEMAQGGGAFGESGNGFLAGGFGEDDAVVLAHGPEELNDADAEFARHFPGCGGPFDRIHDVTKPLIGVLKQQDVASHRVASLWCELEFSHRRRGVCNLFQMGNICRASWMHAGRGNERLPHANEGTSNHCRWRVESCI